MEFASIKVKLCSNQFLVETGTEWSCKAFFYCKDYCNFCTSHMALSTFRTGACLWQELCFPNYFWHACSQVWSISWYQLLKGLWSLLSKILLSLLPNLTGIITYFMGLLSTVYFGLLVFKQGFFLYLISTWSCYSIDVTGMKMHLALPSGLIWTDYWFNRVTVNMSDEFLSAFFL